MNEEIIHIFAECTEAIAQHRLTVDDCLEKHPQYRDELVDLLQVTMQVQAVPTAVPTDEFRQDARTRLLSQLPPRAAGADGKVAPSVLASSTVVA